MFDLTWIKIRQVGFAGHVAENVKTVCVGPNPPPPPKKKAWAVRIC